MIRRAALAVAAVVAVLGMTVGVLVLLGGHAAAPQQVRAVVQGGGVANLKVTPVRVSLPMDTGRVSVPFALVNRGKQPQQVSVSSAEVSPSTGARLADSPAAANRWVRLSRTGLVLAPGATAKVTAVVDIPVRREPGERRVEVYFRAAPLNHGQLSFAVALGASIWIPGPGVVDRGIALSDVRTPLVANPGAVQVGVTVRDTGNVHRDLNPLGTPVVGVSSSGEKFVFSPATVLPGQATAVTARWHTPLACWCELVVSVPGSDGHPVTVRRHVLVFPWAYALAALLIAAGAAAVLPALRARRLVEKGTR